MFRSEGYQTIEDLSVAVKALTDEYFEFIKLDDKPEKGERKVADE